MAQLSNTKIYGNLFVSGDNINNSKIMAKSGSGSALNANNCGYVFTSDNDSGLFNPSDGSLSINVNGVTKMNFTGSKTQITTESEISCAYPTFSLIHSGFDHYPRLIGDQNKFWIEGRTSSAVKQRFIYDLINGDVTIPGALNANGARITTAGTIFDSRIKTGNQQLINANNAEIFVGNSSTKLQLESSSNPVVNRGGSVYTLYHTGNLPNNVASLGNYTAETGLNRPSKQGLSIGAIYNNGYLSNYGNVLTISNAGCSQLAMHWSDTSGAQADIFYRSKRDTSDANWSQWGKLLMTSSEKRAGQFHDGTIAPTSSNRLNYDGYLYATRIYNAVYNDYAEYFERFDIMEKLEPGDIIASNKGKFTKSTKANQKNVVGVYSDSYGHILGGKGDGYDDKNFIPVGLSGRVSVKIIGQAEEGDLVVSSDIPGVGMINNDAKLGTVIGKVIEDKTTNEIGKVKILIM